MVYHFGSKDFQASLCFVASKKKQISLLFHLKKKRGYLHLFQDQLAFSPLKKNQTIKQQFRHFAFHVLGHSFGPHGSALPTWASSGALEFQLDQAVFILTTCVVQIRVLHIALLFDGRRNG